MSGSNAPYWWKCQNGDDLEWRAQVYNRTGIGSGCPFCTVYPRSKIELYLAFELQKFFEFDIDNHKLNSTKGVFDIDIMIRKHKLIVEYDGAYWHQDKERQDRFKTNRLHKLGWRVIRIRESLLERIGPCDILVPFRAGAKLVATRVMNQISRKFNIPIQGFDEYKKRQTPMNTKAADDYIEQLLSKQATRIRRGEVPLSSS